MDIYKKLRGGRIYLDAYKKLEGKAHASPFLLNSAPIDPELTLRFMIDNKEVVIRELRAMVSRRELPLGEVRSQVLLLDKQREVFLQSWPHKILQSALAILLAQELESFYSPRLFSYRKGTGSADAIRDFVHYLRINKESPAIYVLKVDVEKFDQNISHPLLMKSYEQALGNQDPYVYSLIRHFVESAGANTTQLPTGFQITNISENIYLSGVDKYFQNVSDLFYARYCDDIIIASPEMNLLNENLAELERFFVNLGLSISSDKIKRSVFVKEKGSKNAVSSGTYKKSRYVKYLGMNIQSNGLVFISDEKKRRLKSALKSCVDIAHLENKKNLQKKELLSAIIHSLNLLLASDTPLPELKLIFDLSSDNAAIKNLDKWIAKQVVSKFYKGRQDKIFRYISFRQLRELGLRSVYYTKYGAKSQCLS